MNPPKLALLPFKLDPDFLEKIDAARGFKSRSFFIREALANYLRTLGYDITDSMIYPPDRAAAASQASERMMLNDRLDPASPPDVHPAPKQIMNNAPYVQTKRAQKKRAKSQ